ncbi:MAG: hypothetical protein HYX41_06340 [Bdellovibrio sp.]|nr:hypothetical protein [Bdellovibrio sp.]
MKNFTFLCLLAFWATTAQGSLSSQDTEAPKLSDVFGITYFSFFNGPGFLTDTYSYCPNNLGKPSNDGINFQNNVSFRWKFSHKFALDLQARFYLILNNGTDNPNFHNFRWETPRIGISGKLLNGDDWSLSGAINTEFPYFFPTPLSGYQVKQRKVIFNPGMFASFKYEPRNSPWSIFSVVTPRFFLYADRSVAEPQLSYAGFLPGNKPELILSLSPTINYKVGSKSKLTLGTILDYRKYVISSWNPLDASLITNGDDPAWRLSAVPVSLGVTYQFNEQVTIYPYVTAYPIAAQRIDAVTGKQATFLESASIGMWVNGTLF